MQNLAVNGLMNFTEGCRGDVTGGCWLLLIMLLLWLRTICVLSLAAILRINV